MSTNSHIDDTPPRSAMRSERLALLFDWGVNGLLILALFVPSPSGEFRSVTVVALLLALALLFVTETRTKKISPSRRGLRRDLVLLLLLLGVRVLDSVIIIILVTQRSTSAGTICAAILGGLCSGWMMWALTAPRDLAE